MKSDLEARLLASVRTQLDFTRLQGAGIDGDSFDYFRPMYDHIARLVELHGRVPRLLDLKQTFQLPDSVKRSGGEFDLLIEEAQRFQLTTNVQKVLDKNVTEHGNEPQALVDGLVRDLSNLHRPADTQMSLSDTSMLTRMARYEDLANQPKKRGIRTGISYFDETHKMGWFPGELVGVVGRTYVGKSWLLMFFGLMAWQFGKRVLFISPEMSIEETEARFDGMLMAKNNIKVEVADLYRGYVPTEEMKTLARETSSEEGHWMTYASSEEGHFGLASLGQLAWKHKPDLLLIDGLPLLESGKRGQQIWESIKELSYGLKNLAVHHNVAVIVSHQASRRAHNIARPPALHEISLGDAFAQACDRVLALSRPQDLDDILRITVQKFRRGTPHHAGIDFTFEPARGDIHEYIQTDAVRSGRGGGDGDGQRTGNAMPIS